MNRKTLGLVSALRIKAFFLASVTALGLVFVQSAVQASTSQSDTWIQKALELRLHEDPEWKAILHIRGNSPQVDGPNFYLSHHSARNKIKNLSEEELRFTLNSFFSDQGVFPNSADPKKVEKQLGQCKFPLRRKYLTEKLEGLKAVLPVVECKLQSEFKNRVKANKVSLVFSSFYMGSASSTFGHTFLKLSGENSNELFDTGINFAANPTTENAVLYALFGLTGQFPGVYSAVPYYVKVREYSDHERRDLWVYELSLTESERARLLDHIWELGDTYFDYFYFTENCSYQLFELLDVAAPRLKLTQKIPFYVIPSDTVRALARIPGLLTGSGNYRPSAMSKFQARSRLFSEKEKAAFFDLAEGLANAKTINEYGSKNLNVVDGVMDYFELAAVDPLVLKKAQIYRASLGGGGGSPSDSGKDADAGPIPDSENPLFAHSPRQIGLWGGKQNLGLEFKFAMHDLLDPGFGYARDLHIDFARVGLAYEAEEYVRGSRVRLDRLEIFSLTSLAPVDEYFNPWSYRAEMGWIQNEFRLNGGLGKSVRAVRDLTLYGIADAGIRYSWNLPAADLQPWIGPRAGMIYYGTLLSGRKENFRAKLEARLPWHLFTDLEALPNLEFETRFALSQKFLGLVSTRENRWVDRVALGLYAEWNRNRSDFGLRAYFYP